MAAITTRAGKGSRLSHAELDANLTALNAAKVEPEDLGTPALLRGTVSGARWSGVTKGAGAAQAARIATRTGLQAAVDHAAANKKFFELEPGVYDIEGGALTVPATDAAFHWEGTRATVLRQFSTNVPVLRLGDVNNSGVIQAGRFRGVALKYGVGQAGQTGAIALHVHRAWGTTFDEVEIVSDWSGTDWINAPYKGCRIEGDSNAQWFFSNSLHMWKIKGAQHTLLDLHAVGTGNVYENFYLSNGTGGGGPNVDKQRPLIGSALHVSSAGVGNTGDRWTQLNIEWTRANVLARFENTRPTGVEGLHFEGNISTGFEPTCVYAVNSNTMLLIEGMDLTNHRWLSTEGMDASNGSVFSTYGAAGIHVRGLTFYQTFPGLIDRSWRMYQQAGGATGPEHRGCVTVGGIGHFVFNGGTMGDFRFSENATAAEAPAPAAAASWAHRDLFDELVGHTLDLDADFTLYGQHAAAVLRYPASPGAARNVNLAATMRASGTGSAVPVPTGAIATVVRKAGTQNANAITVRNGVGGTAIGSAITAAGAYRYRFNGTAWAAV